MMSPKVIQRRKKSFLLQPLCLFIQYHQKCLSQLLQLNITIQTSHHQLLTGSKCQVILFCYINRKIVAIFYKAFISEFFEYNLVFLGASDELALKISLPVIMLFIIVPLCVMAVVFYSR